MSPLRRGDPEVFDLICREETRQTEGIELIASENFTSAAVMQALGSCLTNKYSEGYPGRRYYGGNEYIDKLERLCWDRALSLFGLDSERWGVNVQPLSGSPANFAVLTALVPTDGTGRIMGLDLPSGGHLTHGYQTTLKSGTVKKISASAIYFNSRGYKTTEACGGRIDYDLLENEALEWKPHMLITGGSAYPREWDYRRLREIADKCGAILMNDMAHISGLVAAGVVDSPFEYCDIVTTTTHKTLRGPRSGMIFYRVGGNGSSGKKLDYKERIDFSVFPSLQGGPHNNVIAGVAVALREASDPAFKEYSKQVILNSQAMADGLIKKGYKLVTDGTDNHLLLWDLRPVGLSGSKMEKMLERCRITVNKNTVLGDKSAMSPGGLRIGTPAVTTRGMTEKDMLWIVGILDECVKLAVRAQEISGSKLLKYFTSVLTDEEYHDFQIELDEVSNRVVEWSKKFPLPGI